MLQAEAKISTFKKYPINFFFKVREKFCELYKKEKNFWKSKKGNVFSFSALLRKFEIGHSDEKINPFQVKADMIGFHLSYSINKFPTYSIFTEFHSSKILHRYCIFCPFFLLFSETAEPINFIFVYNNSQLNFIVLNGKFFFLFQNSFGEKSGESIMKEKINFRSLHLNIA